MKKFVKFLLYYMEFFAPNIWEYFVVRNFIG